jgi:hypothetical protein
VRPRPGNFFFIRRGPGSGPRSGCWETWYIRLKSSPSPRTLSILRLSYPTFCDVAQARR